ncbi:MAG TPA: sugar ABC transporter ATP-binding protein [Propionibacteriaceae bacterium]|nr:sugar ABC transporter ATP-binding protein [Micropruina sp.]HBX79655.1 sugar ABC transporter ATP-binding protein [Propionibacteriaceae bacterium]HBY23723.1 sugar ABC transporter ATP-binding protein [Propionibacteriaceae bacterium]
MVGISKSFNTVTVLENVDFDVLPGEVHALAGGNGAGKSTLMKILQGVYSKDAGSIEVGGEPTSYNSIHEAKAAGIGMVFQEFSLISTLTVAQNVFLNAEPLKGTLIDDKVMVEKAQAIFERMQTPVDPEGHLDTMSTAYWQLTEIAKALSENARVLIMDEPTASLARHEAKALFELIGRLKADGIAIIYISHRMEEVFEIADRITILRNGVRLLTKPLNEITPAQIVEGIVGKAVEVSAASVNADENAPIVLQASGLASSNGVHDLDLTLRAGQVVGLAGLMGSGRSELARALYGIDKITGGSVSVDGSVVAIGSPQEALAHGICLIPEDRRLQGLILDHSVANNLVLPHLDAVTKGPFVDERAVSSLVSRLIDAFAIKVADPSAPAKLLSGGNQQKIVIGKWMSRDPRVLIMDEPTAGVDIGTKAEIIATVRAHAESGMAVLVISSEYSELLAMSDRLLLMRDFTIVREIDRLSVTDEQSLELEVQGVAA